MRIDEKKVLCRKIVALAGKYDITGRPLYLTSLEGVFYLASFSA